MIDIRNLIREPYDLPLQGMRISAGFMIPDTVSDFPGQIQSPALTLQTLYHSDTLLMMPES